MTPATGGSMMVYVLLDEQPDRYRLPVFPAGFALVLTLEVVVGDDYGSYLLLDYQSSNINSKVRL